jgi:HK97 family phage major capsid protein
VNLDNIVRAIGTVEGVGAVATAIFLNPADLTTLRLVKEVAGSAKPVLQPDLQAGGAERIGGATVYSTPALAAGTAIVGDAAQVVVGVRRDVEVAFSSEAKFTADSVAARVTARVDWAPNDIRGLVVVSA